MIDCFDLDFNIICYVRQERKALLPHDACRRLKWEGYGNLPLTSNAFIATN